MYYPDSPTPVSPDFLKKIDQDAPGTWIAQPKMDGHRKICAFNGSTWHVSGKKGGTGEHSKIPAEIMADLLDGYWPDGIVLDCELVGPRMIEHTAGKNMLIVFDVLSIPKAIKESTFIERIMYMNAIMDGIDPTGTIQRSIHWYNPGLFDRFQEQMTNPLSEGLVVRRADSRHLMGRNGCKTNPHCLKIKYRNIREQTHVKEQP